MKLLALCFDFLESQADVFFRNAGVVLEAVTAKEFARFRTRSGNYRAEWSDIQRGVLELEMRQTKRERSLGHALCRIAKHIAADDRNQQRFLERAFAPAHPCAHDVGQITHC